MLVIVSDDRLPRQDRCRQDTSRQRATIIRLDSSKSWLAGKESWNHLASMFMGIGNENVSGRAVVIGHVGTGKTVLTRRFGEDVVRGVGWHQKDVLSHVNCRNHPSTSQVLQQIALSLDSGTLREGLALGRLFSRYGEIFDRGDST